MTGSLAVRRRLTQGSEASVDQSPFFKRTLEADPVVGGLGGLSVTNQWVQFWNHDRNSKLAGHGERGITIPTVATKVT